ncbi:MAG: redox-regulated ATPase YchF, partial [Candidatus Zixiibacteriota bacterium]
IRQMDAFLLVIDAFSDAAEPDRDIQNLMDEMILIDQAMIESNIDKRQRKMKLTGDKAEQRELDLLKRCLGKLEEERPLIDLDFGLEESRIIRGYQLLTCKPVLIVINVPEEALAEVESFAGRFQRFAESGKREIAVMCGKIEAELVTLKEEERAPFLEELGIGTPAIDLVIRRSYALLGLISFFTTAGPEIRAWTIPGGTPARRAAGVVHADMERGFIRAEVVSYDDFIEYRTPAALKAAGKTRLEGKDYMIGDGDVILFRFNV